MLETDASNLCIGGYLYLLVDNVARPVKFMSKSLSKEKMRWAVPQKEMYAIYYAFVKFEHLIRDVHFTLRTDHKNLTYLNTDNQRS